MKATTNKRTRSFNSQGGNSQLCGYGVATRMDSRQNLNTKTKQLQERRKEPLTTLKPSTVNLALSPLKVPFLKIFIIVNYRNL